MIITRISKTLSANDTGDTGAHQAGILIPRDDRILKFFPDLDIRELNPRCHLTFEDASGDKWTLAFIYYNNRQFGGTRNEYRLTRMTRFIREHALSPGDEVVLEREQSNRWRISARRAGSKTSTKTSEFVLKLGSGWKISTI